MENIINKSDAEKPRTSNAVSEKPFVNEECGDTMWDEVLNQSAICSTNEVLNDSKPGFRL